MTKEFLGSAPSIDRQSVGFLDCGRMQYESCLELQQKLHAEAVATGRGTIVCVEHPSVITLGKHADPRFVLFNQEQLKRAEISLCQTDRGGEATVHNPGQMVLYPILNLAALGVGAKVYVNALERAVIEFLREIAINAHTDSAYPGVWVEHNKICAVGVRIKDRATMHGIALNVSNDLAIFNTIVPCGITNRGVTSIWELTRQRFEIREVGAKVALLLAKELDLQMFGVSDATRLESPPT